MSLCIIERLRWQHLPNCRWRFGKEIERENTMRHHVILLALLVCGCVQEQVQAPQPEYKTYAQKIAETKARIAVSDRRREEEQAQTDALWKDRNAALMDGRIKIGMTFDDFLVIWQHNKEGAKMSSSQFENHFIGTTDYMDCTDRVYPRCRHVIFTFDNGLLESWHQY
jgi:hypothetical protein